MEERVLSVEEARRTAADAAEAFYSADEAYSAALSQYMIKYHTLGGLSPEQRMEAEVESFLAAKAFRDAKARYAHAMAEYILAKEHARAGQKDAK